MSELVREIVDDDLPKVRDLLIKANLREIIRI